MDFLLIGSNGNNYCKGVFSYKKKIYDIYDRFVILLVPHFNPRNYSSYQRPWIRLILSRKGPEYMIYNIMYINITCVIYQR